MSEALPMTYYSDVLCVWAHIAQSRVDEVSRAFPHDVHIDYRFCSVFGDTPNKIGKGWAERGGYAAFGQHVQESAKEYVEIHADLWGTTRPFSSTPAHLVLHAAKRLDPDLVRPLLLEVRRAFFERCEDISRQSVLLGLVEKQGVDVDSLTQLIQSGQAYADLEADIREQHRLGVQGSPTFILNEGRQKLYGNVGYRVIEANIRELLRKGSSSEASWC